MKKIIALLLVIVMTALLLASCGDKLTPVEQYHEAVKKSNELETRALHTQMKETITMKGKSTQVMDSTVTEPDQTIVLEMTSDSYYESETKFRMDSHISYDTFAQDTKVYRDGAWIYVETDGKGAKIPADSELADSLGNFGLVEDVAFDETIENVTVEKNKNGKTFSFTLTENEFSDLFGEMIDTAFATAVDDTVKVLSSKIGGIQYEMTTNKKGYMTKSEMSFVLNMTIEAEGETEEMSLVMEVVSEFLNPGKPVTAEPIPGYEKFEEVPV